ncbi:MAG: hypothetical protein LBC74_00910 [Planctomycetaceae bacterium]|jgi:hypothetical protein|nr:hypothetical protein [Planctomycetaceae bacterium]
MKTIYVLSLCILLFEGLITKLNANDMQNNLAVSDHEKIESSFSKIRRLIDKKPIDFKKIISEINELEKNIKVSFPLLISKIRDLVGSIQNHAEDKDVTELAKYLVDKYACFSFDRSKLNILEQIEFDEIQLQILLVPQYKYYISDALNDCDPLGRKKHSSQLLALYQNIVLHIDDKFDLNAKENQIIKNGFNPPDSYKEPYNSGQDMSDVKDKATREAYEKYIEEQNQKIDRREIQRLATFVRKRYSKEVAKYLIDAYSLFPYRAAELEKMLKEKKVDSEMSQTILDAVRKREKENPDEDFRIWLSKDKLFTTEAKMISADKDNVTIKDKQGRQSTIELSAHRQEDQDYVKRQRELKTKTSP